MPRSENCCLEIIKNWLDGNIKFETKSSVSYYGLLEEKKRVERKKKKRKNCFNACLFDREEIKLGRENRRDLKSWDPYFLFFSNVDGF